jgi:hypothetical protein
MLAYVSNTGIFWDFLWFFFLFLWIILLFHILADLFRDHSTSGWAKAAWCVFLIFLPFLAVFVYLIARGSGMAKRSIAAQQEAQSQFDDYVRSTAGAASPADQIAKAKELLDAGTITQADFDAIKAKALS